MKTCDWCQCAEDHKGDVQEHLGQNLCYDCFLDREEG